MRQINTMNQWRRYVRQRGLLWHIEGQRFVRRHCAGVTHDTGTICAESEFCASRMATRAVNGKWLLGRRLRSRLMAKYY